jgi:ABC-type molybdenum transport system ATPase subunit/photorepair protein PhrA
MVFDVVEAIGRQGRTQILLVTHFEDELPDCIRHILRLGGGLPVVEARTAGRAIKTSAGGGRLNLRP